MMSTTVTTGTIASGTSVGSTSLAKEFIQGNLNSLDYRKPLFEPVTLRLTKRRKFVVNSLQNGWPIRPICFNFFSHNLK